MKVATIPNKFTQKGDFVLIPRKEYKWFSIWKKAVNAQPKAHWFWTPEWQKKERGADKAIQTKKVSRPFSNHKDLLMALKKK